MVLWELLSWLRVVRKKDYDQKFQSEKQMASANMSINLKFEISEIEIMQCLQFGCLMLTITSR